MLGITMNNCDQICITRPWNVIKTFESLTHIKCMGTVTGFLICTCVPETRFLLEFPCYMIR